MNSNIINVILIKKCYQKGTFVKDATIIAFDLKKLLTLGNSVSWGKWFHYVVGLDSGGILKTI